MGEIRSGILRRVDLAGDHPKDREEMDKVTQHNYTPWIENDRIDFTRAEVYSFTSQGGPSPAGLRVQLIGTSRVGTITDGPHTTYGCTVKFDDTGLSHYIGTDRLTFYGDGRGGCPKWCALTHGEREVR